VHFPTPGEVITALDLGDGWEVQRKDIHPRHQKDENGNTVIRNDATVKLRRR
jgi:hypothetical protein